jgi:GntR family transcriptional regulator
MNDRPVGDADTRDEPLPPSPPQPGDSQPRYMQILQVIRNRIIAGEYQLDSLVPTEAELCDEFGVSRYTVREALRRLTELGFVARKQGSGTLVISSDPGPVFTHSMRSLTELFQYALDTYLEINAIAPTRISAADAALLGVPEGSEWLRLTGVRHTHRGGQIICHTTVFIHMRFAWLRDEMPACRGPIYALIERRAQEPIAEAIQTTNAVPMPEHVCKALNEPPGSFALRMMRRYLDRNGEIMVASMNHHPSDRFTYTMRIKRDDFE